MPIGGGMQLDPGKPWTLDTGDTNTTRLWARMGCSFDGNGTETCQKRLDRSSDGLKLLL